MDSLESPFQFECQPTHGILSLNPLINDGQWGTVTEVGNEILAQLDTMLAPALVVDLSRLTYIGSPQVALLVRVWKSLKKLQGRMSVECPCDLIREVLNTAGLRSLWEIADTRDAALLAVGVPRTPVRPTTSRWGWLRLGSLWPITPSVASAK